MPLVPKSVTDPTFLNAALEGLELQKQRIEEQIAYVRSLLGKSGGRATTRKNSAAAGDIAGLVAAPATKTRKKRVLSPAARKRIAEAQKKRWAEFRKEK